MWEEAEEWWGKQFTLSVGFFRGVVNTLCNTWYIVEGGEVIAKDKASSIEDAKAAVELRMAAIFNE